MAENVHAALTFRQNENLKELDSKMAKEDVQQVMDILKKFIETYQEYFVDGQINLFAIESRPFVREKTSRTAFVLVNLTGRTVTEFNAHIEIEVSDFDVEFEAVDWEIGSDFLGSWGDHYAILVVDDIPFEGTPTKSTYTLNDLTVTVSDVSITSN